MISFILGTLVGVIIGFTISCLFAAEKIKDLESSLDAQDIRINFLIHALSSKEDN